jgi:hypothetical protein
LTYPEEVGIDQLAIDLPEDWKAALYRITVSPYLSRDPRAFLNKVMRIAKFITDEQTFHGSQAEWIDISKSQDVNVLRTRYDAEKGRIDVSLGDSIIQSKADIPKYVILDVNGVPLQNRKSSGFTLEESELPASIYEAVTNAVN